MSHLTARRSIANSRARVAQQKHADHLAKLVRQQAAPTAKPIVEKCWSCSAKVETDGNVQPVACATCRQSFLEAAITEFRDALKSLRNRTGAFANVTPGRRDAVLCELGFGRPFTDMIELSDDALIDLAAGCAGEIERRAMSVELSPATRRAVEQSVIDNHFEDRFDAQFYANNY